MRTFGKKKSIFFSKFSYDFCQCILGDIFPLNSTAALSHPFEDSGSTSLVGSQSAGPLVYQYKPALSALSHTQHSKHSITSLCKDACVSPGPPIAFMMPGTTKGEKQLVFQVPSSTPVSLPIKTSVSLPGSNTLAGPITAHSAVSMVPQVSLAGRTSPLGFLGSVALSAATNQTKQMQAANLLQTLSSNAPLLQASLQAKPVSFVHRTAKPE